MAILHYNTYKNLAANHSVVPVFKELNADLETPVSIFLKAKGNFLLESLEKGSQAGRYSIIGKGSLLSVSLRGNTVETIKTVTNGNVDRESITTDDFLGFLRELMGEYQPPELTELPPFWGGLVGYLGYETASFIENVPMHPAGSEDIPDAFLVIPRIVIVCDGVRRTACVIATTFPGGNQKKTYEDAMVEINSCVEQIQRERVPIEDEIFPPGDIVRTEPSPSEFMKMVESCVNHINAGDIIQGVLSRKTVLKTEEPALSLYRKLRRANPSPYMFYLDYGDFVLTGSSPEVMVRVQGDELFLKPIAGTRARGATVKEDSILSEELLSDQKEMAEHLMLVDLGRNDLGRVAHPGSIEVTDFMSVEKFSHVMHIVSSVQGRMKTDADAFDVVKASFPAGTLTGAPKIKAMEIITELEVERRGHYGGMILYLGFNGNLDSCITIRSMLCKNGEVTVQAGAGIVADSVAENELLETENKARALISVITGEEC